MKNFIRNNLWFLVFLLVLPLIQRASQIFPPYIFMILIQSGINAILAVSLNLVSGMAGQFSLGHAGFMAVGAYISALFTTTITTAWPEVAAIANGQILFVVALILGGAAAAGFGWLVGLPSLRLRGDYLAIVTLGFGEIIRVLILNLDCLGGARGFSGIPPYSSFAAVYGCLVFTLTIIWRLRESHRGRALLAIREDEIAAESVGVATTHYKVLAFVLAAGFAGMAGALFAHTFSFISPPSFSFMKSFEIIIMVVLGGMGSLSGSVISAFLVTCLPEVLRPVQNLTGVDLRLVIYSLLLIIIMLTRPYGLMGGRHLPQMLVQLNKRFGFRN